MIFLGKVLLRIFLTVERGKGNIFLLKTIFFICGTSMNIPVDRTAPLSFEDKLSVLQEVCRTTGLKLTHQRLEILRELAQAKDHPSVETIHKRVQVRMPTISLDTVYRTIATFERHGLITRMHVFDDQGRFDADLSPHHHLVCTQCKSIEDFRWEAFDKAKLPPEIGEWGQVYTKHTVLRGVCRACLKRKK
jgi:Fur family peroxide stress response transcriptional regulator